jgi:hypothetical protein
MARRPFNAASDAGADEEPGTPVANNDTATTAAETCRTTLANDTDVGGTPTVTAVSTSNGTALINPDNTYQYPGRELQRHGDLTYTVTDTGGLMPPPSSR